MLNIPILLDFDNNQLIGHLIVDEKMLPPLSDYVFALGVRHLDTDGTYELVSVSVVADANYVEYLKQRGLE